MVEVQNAVYDSQDEEYLENMLNSVGVGIRYGSLTWDRQTELRLMAGACEGMSPSSLGPEKKSPLVIFHCS